MNKAVGVLSIYDSRKNSFYPYKIKWNNRYYTVKKICYHHMVREGRVAIHIFHVTDGDIDFRLAFDTEALKWTLEDFYDESSVS